MKINASRKRILNGLLSICIAVTGVAYVATPAPAAELNGSELDFHVGWLDSKGKPVDGSYDLSDITGPSLTQKNMAVTKIDMLIDDQKKGTALNFSWMESDSDNGYIFGTLSEAAEWATMFNGNPSYVNGGGSNAYGHEIYNKGSLSTHRNMKNLAEVAIASGGWGVYDHSSLYDTGGGKYRRKAKFFTTPRPTREVKTDKTTYQPNETVKISPSATDYSKYDKGIEVLNLWVINKTTGRGYLQYKDQMKYYPDPVNADKPSYTWNNGGVPLEYKPPAGGHEPGTYEVHLLIVDSKKRSNRESSDIRVATDAIATFTVGGAAPAVCANINVHFGTNASAPTMSPGETQIVTSGDAVKFFAEANGTGAKGDWKVEGYPAFNASNTAAYSFTVPDAQGQTLVVTYSLPGSSVSCKTFYLKVNSQGSIPCPPSDSSKAEKMDIMHKLNSGSSEATEYSLLTPHATAIADIKVNAEWMNSKQEKVTIKPSNAGSGGSWYVDGAPAKASAVLYNGTGLVISDYATSISEDDSMTFKVEYRGSNGKVWCYNVTLTTEKRTGPVQASCPKVYNMHVGGELLSSGTTLYRTPETAEFDFHVVYNTGHDDNQPYTVEWEVVYPDGSVHPWPIIEGDRGYGQYETDNFTYKSTYNKGLPTKYQVWFTTPGTYKIRNNQHEMMKEYEEVDCPPWVINIVIATSPPVAGCEGFSLGPVTVDGIQRTFSSGTGTPSNPYILTISPGEENYTEFKALYNGQPSVKVYWRMKYKLGGSGGADYGTAYTFDDDPATVPDGYTVTVSRTNPDQGGVEICYTIKVVWGDPPNALDCDNLYLRAKVDGAFAKKEGSGTQSDPYKIRMTAGSAHDVEFYALFDNGSGNGTTKGIDSVKWELVGKNGTNTSSSNPYTKRFNDSSATTYTLKATIKGDGITCIKYMEITISEAGCDDMYIHYWSSVRNKWFSDTGAESHENPGTGMTHPLTSSEPIDIKIAVTTTNDDPSTSNRLKVTWTATNKLTGQSLTNQSSNPSEMFQKNALPAGTYFIKAKVTDSRYPALLNCEIYLTITVTDTSGGCDAVYLHIVEGFGGEFKETVVKSGAQVSYPSAPDEITLILWDSPAPILEVSGGSWISADWTAPPPMENVVPENIGFRPKDQLKEGSYTINAKVNDPQWPNANGCNFTVTIIIGQDMPSEPPPCTSCEPGGEIPGGKMNLKVYDSDNRLLVSTADGTWEKEPARIEVEIDQNQINSAFAQADQEIAQAIVDKKAYFEAKYPAPDYENVVVTASPSTWNSKTNSMTKWPSSVPMSVSGPGIDKNFALNPKLSVQSNIYDGTTVPTLTTWAMQLNSEDYVVKADSFQIDVPYKVDFDVSYEKCEEKPDPDDPDAPPTKECTPGTDRESIQNSFTINVLGDDTQFEVYEPNAKGILLHTPEWVEKHSRDRYKASTNNSFYAGETILTHVIFEPRHKHPFSNQYPVILSATSWMQERGGKNTDLRNSLNLVKVGLEWHGPQIQVAKLGSREDGVDIMKMGDVWTGLQRGNYSIYFLPRFKFGVNKGYPIYDKTKLRGHNMDDYKVPLEILGNAYEWQGYKTHYK
ncbi:hypothetical protein P9G84_13735 [Brevibacillus centrosporus]|uniref:hypothetical protein n=1 Tax=Brevibacillus centrosporus TaxID=54910 RepID=UPI00114420AC|nr:hypothetical protein [Brevibacillus centrosporus]MEC2130004.1 hypothetical protein [Brevibacillus centrosporus]GED32383.1 hypothetical protein BCE02nite_35240 [Brevibacillus centrosporus]